jgi:predicted ATPase with chaperone activity
MTARVSTVAFQGIDVLDIDVQVQVSSGIVAFTVVGLPDKAVGESRERVRAALNALGLALPPKRITVNLAPADVLKEGSHFDLPIALGLLVARRASTSLSSVLKEVRRVLAAPAAASASAARSMPALQTRASVPAAAR